MTEEQFAIRVHLRQYWKRRMCARAAAVEICEMEGECRAGKIISVVEWFRRFSNCETSFEGQKSSGRPSTINIGVLRRELVEQQLQTSTLRFSTELSPSKSIVFRRHFNKSGVVNWRCNRESPHELTVAEHQRRRRGNDLCTTPLENHTNRRFWIRRIFTGGDEMW